MAENKEEKQEPARPVEREVTVKMRDLVGSVDALNVLLAYPLMIKRRFSLSKLQRSVNPLLGAFNDTHQAMSKALEEKYKIEADPALSAEENEKRRVNALREQTKEYNLEYNKLLDHEETITVPVMTEEEFEAEIIAAEELIQKTGIQAKPLNAGHITALAWMWGE